VVEKTSVLIEVVEDEEVKDKLEDQEEEYVFCVNEEAGVSRGRRLAGSEEMEFEEEDVG